MQYYISTVLIKKLEKILRNIKPREKPASETKLDHKLIRWNHQFLLVMPYKKKARFE